MTFSLSPCNISHAGPPLRRLPLAATPAHGALWRHRHLVITLFLILLLLLVAGLAVPTRQVATGVLVVLAVADAVIQLAEQELLVKVTMVERVFRLVLLLVVAEVVVLVLQVQTQTQHHHTVKVEMVLHHL